MHKNSSIDFVSTQTIKSLPNQQLIKNKKILLIFLLGIGGLIFFYQKKDQQRKSLTIQDVPEIVFVEKESTIGELTIKHPSDWYINEFEHEDEKIKGFSISNYKERCDCKDYQLLSVSYLGKNRYSQQANTAKQYVDTDYEIWLEEERENIDKGLLPTTPGYVETYYRDASYIFNQNTVDAVELKTFGNEGFKFLILKNDQVYQISFQNKLNSNNENKAIMDDADPIIQILKTVTINDEPLVW